MKIHHKSNNDQLRIADFRYYNTGDRLSKQIITNTADLEGSIGPAQQDYPKAIASLTEMETRYGIKVTELAEKELSPDFVSSKSYRNLAP